MKAKLLSSALALALLLALFQPVKASSPEPLSVERQVYQYLTQELELNSAAACGVLANIEHESAFNLTILGDGGTSFGLCQWHNSRYNALIGFCNSQGLDYQSVEGQMRYLSYELKTGYYPVLANLRHLDNSPEGAYRAAYLWCTQFERPANVEYQASNRAATAQFKYWNRYNADSISTTYMPTSSAEHLAEVMIEELRTANLYDVNPAPAQQTTWNPEPTEVPAAGQESQTEDASPAPANSSVKAPTEATPSGEAPTPSTRGAQRIHWKEFPVRQIFRAPSSAPAAAQSPDCSAGIAIGLGLMPMGDSPRRKSALFVSEEEPVTV